MGFIPLLHVIGVFALEEDAANTGYFFHVFILDES
jgi:hypothetical protein